MNRFLYFLRTAHREGLARRVKRRSERLREPSSKGSRELLAEVRTNLQAVNESMREPLAQRATVLNPVIEEFHRRGSASHVCHSILAAPRAQLVSYRVAPSRVEMIQDMSRELALRRAAGRITMLGEVANMELLLAAAHGPEAAPAWLEMLEAAVRSHSIRDKPIAEPEAPATSHSHSSGLMTD